MAPITRNLSKQNEIYNDGNINGNGVNSTEVNTTVNNEVNVNEIFDNSEVNTNEMFDNNVLFSETRDSSNPNLTTKLDKEIYLKELRVQELMLMKEMGNTNTSYDNVNTTRQNKGVEYFSKILKSLMPVIPQDVGELPLLFQAIENIFKLQDVPREIQGKVLMPFLGELGRPLLVALSSDELADYETIKRSILKCNRLTPVEYRKRFDEAKRKPDEQWPQFANRLKALWKFYVDSKNANTIDLINELIVTDRLKASLPCDARQYIAMQEADESKRIDDVAFLAEVFESAKSQNVKPHFKESKVIKETKGVGQFVPRYRPPQMRSEASNRGQIVCYKCHRSGHLARFCTLGSAPREQVGESAKETQRGFGAAGPVVARVSHSGLGDKTRNVTTPVLTKLETVNLRYRGKDIVAIVDSGACIDVINKDLLLPEDEQSSGTIMLESAFGQIIEADLLTIPISWEGASGSVKPEASFLVAATKDLNGDMLVTPRSLEELKEQANVYCGQINAVVEIVENVKVNDNEQEASEDSGEKGEFSGMFGTLFEEIEENSSADNRLNEVWVKSSRELLMEEQQECPTLKGMWDKVALGKGKEFIMEGLLYYKGEVGGSKVSQLVLPESRRSGVLKLAHESVFGAHMGHKKTAQRIKYSFWWPTIDLDVRNFIATCEGCQLKGRITVADRVPITPITRPELPFQVVNVDIIGKIDPPSGRGHRWALTLVDQHTRWAEAVPLKTLTAKETCEALLNIFMRTGIPSVICSDQGTGFTSELTRMFYELMGSSPRFSTPNHPESNGLVERWNGTLKKMMHHVIRENPRDWDRALKFLLWAYREVPHSTTGVAPFKLMYGRDPVGPLHILQESLTGKGYIPNLDVSIPKYLEQLRERMEEAADLAKLTAENQQRIMARDYNKKAKEKDFQVGEQVIILVPDSTNKLFSRWTGPAKVVEKPRPNSYLVELRDGARKIVHANKVRSFKARINMVGVVYESDEEFGNIEHVPLNVDLDIEERNFYLIDNKISHLNAKQKAELQQVLSEFKDLFSGNLRKALVGEHEIKLKKGAIRSQPKLYRVPEVLREKVNEQIDELLHRGLIRPSKSEFTHPIVCVSKKESSEIRICVDYKSLNAVSLVDPFPMENIRELLFEVAKANYITTLDMLKGYWLIPMAEESKHLTAFSTNRGNYEWEVMPFGLQGSSATFQRTVNQALNEHRKYSRAYIDDVAIYSETWEEHIIHIRAVLNKLEELKFSVNLAKCKFAQAEVPYLGHVIGSGKHRPDPGKLSAIQNLKRPQTKKELRSVLGLCNYYRDYLPNYSTIALPLTELTKRRFPTKIPWSQEHDVAFQNLKDELCSTTALTAPQVGMPYILYTDASDVGVGACLAQKDKKGVIRPIAFASSKLSPTQKNWATGEREAYAAMWALRKFVVWVFGSPVELVTDHNPLVYITKGCSPSPKLQRWALALQRYDLTIVHRKGGEHQNADALSRLVSTSENMPKTPAIEPGVKGSPGTVFSG